MKISEVLHTVALLNTTMMNVHYARVNNIDTLDEIDLAIVRKKLMTAIRLLELGTAIEPERGGNWISDTTQRN